MIQYDEALNLAICRPNGVFERNLASELLDFLEAMETARPTGFNRLLDLKGIQEIFLTGTDLYRIAKSRRSAAENIPACRSAIFAPNLLTFAIAKIYEELMDGSNIQVRVFSEVKATSEWLGVPEAGLGLSEQESGM
jgi:hypothetical protein